MPPRRACDVCFKRKVSWKYPRVTFGEARSPPALAMLRFWLDPMFHPESRPSLRLVQPPRYRMHVHKAATEEKATPVSRSHLPIPTYGGKLRTKPMLAGSLHMTSMRYTNVSSSWRAIVVGEVLKLKSPGMHLASKLAQWPVRLNKVNFFVLGRSRAEVSTRVRQVP